MDCKNGTNDKNGKNGTKPIASNEGNSKKKVKNAKNSTATKKGNIISKCIKSTELSITRKIQSEMKENLDILDKCSKNEFIESLEYAFSDSKHLHYVLEFCQGCDLMSILIKHKKLTEEQSCFYFIELVLGVNEIHKLGFIHRELKPDNIYISNTGHIKIGRLYFLCLFFVLFFICFVGL